MGVNIIDGGRIEFGVAQGTGHGIGGSGAVFFWLRDMAGIATRTVANHFGIDLRPASTSVFKFFEDQQAGTFAENEAIAIEIERATGTSRFLVARGERLDIRKGTQAHPRHRRFRSTCDHHVGIIILNGFQRIANGIGRTGACGGHGVVRASQAELDGQVPSRRVQHHLGNRHRRNARGSLLEQLKHLRFDFAQPTDPRPENHAATEGLFLLEIDARVTNRLRTSHHRELGKAIDPLHFLQRNKFARIPVVDVSTELDLEFVGIETAQRMDAAFTRQDPTPKVIDLATERCHNTETGYDDSSFHARAGWGY